MTTIAVVNNITLYGAMGLWISGSSALVPREEIFPPNLSEQQVEQQNEQLFQDSETTAETAALRFLGYPTQVLVDQLLPDGAARGKLAAGDRLRTIDGRPVRTAEQVVDQLSASSPGQVARVGFQRGDTPPQEVAVELGTGAEQGRGYLGIGVGEEPDVDFDITISLADVGGPSAGLMFALAIVDKLTPGSLSGGTFVAGTGEINPDGRVDPIGGIPFKMIRARDKGATVFLVPADNCAEAAQRTPDGLRLVRVADLADAVHALDALRAGRPVPGCAP